MICWLWPSCLSPGRSCRCTRDRARCCGTSRPRARQRCKFPVEHVTGMAESLPWGFTSPLSRAPFARGRQVPQPGTIAAVLALHEVGHGDGCGRALNHLVTRRGTDGLLRHRPDTEGEQQDMPATTFRFLCPRLLHQAVVRPAVLISPKFPNRDFCRRSWHTACRLMFDWRRHGCKRIYRELW
jgi:hypothetical protein